MTDPGPMITVDAPIGSEPARASGSPVLRVLAALGGALVLLAGAMISLGVVLAGALGVGIGALIVKRRGRRLSRLISWVAAVGAVGLVGLVVGIVVVTRLPEGTLANLRASIDSVAATQEPIVGTQAQADSARAAFQQSPAGGAVVAVSAFIGGYIALSIIAIFYGTIGWGGAMLLWYAFTGAWPEKKSRPARRYEPAPPRVE